MSRVALLSGLSDITPSVWDALAAPEQATGRPSDPFTTYRFLNALEASQSTGPHSGWNLRPLVVQDGDNILAATLLYAKTHSQGEYIFDHTWAEAYMRAGGQYYPKLQIAVPFTPVTGRRFFGAPEHHKTLIDGAISLAAQNGLSSLHITFCTADEAKSFAGHNGLMHRITHQYHWENRRYADFEGFLADLSSRKRKAIRKERQTANAAGLQIRSLTGDDIKPEHWDAFWAFYQDTGARKWGTPYLTRAAFDHFHSAMRDDILLVLAFDGDAPIAGALNFIGRDVLYGRYWGCLRDIPCLHFELCYYRAMDWAIAHGLSRVEAGAQGEHKLARGYLPAQIHSLHWIADQGFRSAIANYLDQERAGVGEDIATLTADSPFRKA